MTTRTPQDPRTPPATLNVLDFGARGNGRTDDTRPIARALEAAGEHEGVTVLFPRGAYLVGAGPCLDTTALVLREAAGVRLVGSGATLLQGPHALRTLGIFACERIRVEGLRFIGSTAHAGQRYYQHSAAVAVNYGSRDVTIENCYITNYLGD